MREVDLFAEYLARERMRHEAAALKLLLDGQPETAAHEAWIGTSIAQLIKDLRVLDNDTGEFIKRFLQ